MKRLVLAGAGHAHAQVLSGLARDPLPGVEVWVVSPQALAPYSGMVPGWLAGHYRYDEIAIDFVRLAAAAGARWRAGEITALDPAQRRLQLADGSTLDYDVLSLNVGSTLTPAVATTPDITVLPLRPIALLRARYEAWIARQIKANGAPAVRITAVGGGAAGFECLLAVLHRLRTACPGRTVTGRLVSRSPVLLPGFAPGARRAALRALERAGVALQLGRDVEGSNASTLRGGDGSASLGAFPGVSPGVSFGASEALLWATGAEAHLWQRDPARRGGLMVDAQGFVEVDERLHSVSHPEILAAGDCARWPHRPLAKAGVHAVRMGPVLLHNLRAALGTAAARPIAHRPQRHLLALLGTADGRAIAARGAFAAEGAWVWRWKDRIDRRFVERFGQGSAGPA